MVLKEYAAIDIETKDGKTYSVDESGIIRDSLTTSSSCSSSGGIPAGSCNAGTISVSFRPPAGLTYSKLAKAKVHLYVWYENNSKTKVGVYNVTSAENNYGIYTVSGSDNVGLLDDGCYSAVDTENAQNWLFTVLSGKFKPVSVIFNQICNAYGVPHYNASENEKIIPESGNTMLCTCVSEECSIESVKDFANYIAEYLGCFIVPAPDGRLRFCRFGDRKCGVELNETNIQRGSYQRSPYYAAPTIWKIGFDSGFGGWWRRTTDTPDNAAPLSVNLTNNPFWQAQEDMIPNQYGGKVTQMIKYMWSYICDAAYADDGNPCFNPFRCTVFVQYYFRVGDMVTIVDPFTGKKFKSYVTDVTWTFRGGQQISFAGEDTRTLSVSTNRNAAKKANDYSKYLYRKSKNGSGENVNTKYALSKSGHTITLTGSDGTVYNVTDDDTIYTHPSHTSHAKGFYKFANNSEGHVTDAGKVTKKDITDLGIPGEDTNTTYELALPTYASQKEPPAPMLSLNGSDGSENKQTIPCAYTVLDDIVYKEFSGFKIGGKYRSVADLAFVIPRSARIYPWRITANVAIETPSGNTYIDLYYALEITDKGSSIRRYLGNEKYYYGNSCATNDWAILSDLQNFSNPDRDVWLYRIGVPDDVFNKLTNAYCEARLVYQTGKNGDVVKPVSYYKDITFDENVHAMDTNLVYVLTKADVSDVAFTGSYNDLSDKPTIPDVSGKQDKLTAGTNITISGSTISAKDTTYSDATQSAHGLMTAADKKKLDGIAAGATKVAVDSALSATSTNPVQNKAVKAALDSKSASGHTHAMITNSALWVSGANNTAKWVKLGTLVSSGNFSNAMIRVWSGDGANGRANQNSSFEVQIKDGWQSTESATKACGVTVYRVDCSSVKVKVIPTAHDTYTVWAYLPWGYWNGNYAVYGKYKSWTSQHLIQSEEPEGTGADTAYYDQAFLTSTVAAAKTLTDSGWVAMTVEGYAKSGTVKYRTYGKQITITGSVVLKNDIATSYPAPQYIASTTFDFSKIVGCSGVGRSSSGVGAYVTVENYNGDNLVCVYALGSKIAAGATLYFTITGFSD